MGELRMTAALCLGLALAARGGGQGRPPEKAAAKDMAALWKDLAGDDAPRAFQAIRAMVAAPKESVAFLGEHLKPVTPLPADRVARLIADLGSERFAVREGATQELTKMVDLVEFDLRKALDAKPTLEVRKRLEEVLAHADAPVLSGESLRSVRAVEVLEYIGDEGARKLLARLARGAPGARLTREAEAASQRLAKRPQGMR